MFSVMEKNWLGPGFRFHPTDVELVKYYLKRKVMGKKFCYKAIAEVDIYKHAPWDLPDLSYLKTGDRKWFFFCPVEKKYGKGARLNRATAYGYWKTTGKDRSVKHNEQVVGTIKSLVFHRGKAPRGERTDWVMHEYSLKENDSADKSGVVQDSYVLCVVFKKDGMGPGNGAQYGAPFKEEDWIWSDDDEEDQNLPPGTASLFGMSKPAVGAASCCAAPAESLCAGPAPSVESSGLDTLPLVVHANATVVTADIDSNTYAAPASADAPQVPLIADAEVVPALPLMELAPQLQESNDNILLMLDIFDDTNDRVQATGNANDSLLEAPQFSDDEDDFLSFLASSMEDNNFNNLLYHFE